MKLMIYRTFLLMLITFSLAMTAGSLAAQVYKVVDENGNVTYTDRPPADGSEPMVLPPISIIETPDYYTNTRQADSSVDGNIVEEIPIDTLRRNYRDFAITSPLPEESFWGSEQDVLISWGTGNQLQAGMKVSIFVNGAAMPVATQVIIPAGSLERGAHTVTAQLKDAKNRIVATAAPVTFYVRQPNIYTNRPGPGA